MKNPKNIKGFKGILLAMSLLAGFSLNGQIIECILDDSGGSGNPPEASTSHCDDVLNYVVDQENLSHHPQLLIWVNFHFIRRNDGTGNFKEPGEPLLQTQLGGIELDGVAAALNLLGHMNARMGDFEQYNQSNAAHVPESGIRFDIFSDPGNPNDLYGGIFFHESDMYFNLGYNGNHPVILKNNFTEYGARVLDIFFVE